jgi:hypothetical protein
MVLQSFAPWGNDPLSALGFSDHAPMVRWLTDSIAPAITLNLFNHRHEGYPFFHFRVVWKQQRLHSILFLDGDESTEN